MVVSRPNRLVVLPARSSWARVCLIWTKVESCVAAGRACGGDAYPPAEPVYDDGDAALSLEKKGDLLELSLSQ